MANTKPKILDYIGRRVRGSLVTGILLQLLAFCIVLPFLAYHDALSRAKFLSTSSSNSLALMMSTGDIFQAQILLDSFVSEQTPYATVLDSDGADLRVRNKSPYASKIDSRRAFAFENGALSIITRHEIEYNQTRLGTLVLVNNIVLTYWVIVLSVFIIFSMFTFYLQSRSLKNLSVGIGSGILDLQKYLEIPDGGEAKIREGTLNILEIDTLAERIQEMMRAVARSIKMEKEAAVGRITSSLAHDMRVPLGVFERLLFESPNTPISTFSPGIRESLNKLHSMIESLRNSEVEVLVKRSMESLNFEHAWASLNQKALDRGIKLEQLAHSYPTAFVDLGKVERAWGNLVSNAIEAASSMVRLGIEENESELIFSVMDDGPGVSQAIASKLFSRGVTHNKEGGTGLGLAYVKQVAQGHGGDVSYLRNNGWTVFRMCLPGAVRQVNFPENGEPTTEIKELAQNKVKRVSLMLLPEDLNKCLFEKLVGLDSEFHEFCLGYADAADIFICNASKFSEYQFPEASRVILFEDSLSPREILRRAPIRLGLKG